MRELHITHILSTKTVFFLNMQHKLPNFFSYAITNIKYKWVLNYRKMLIYY